MWWIVFVSNAYQSYSFGVFALNEERATSKAWRKWWGQNCREFGKEEDYHATPATRAQVEALKAAPVGYLSAM